MVITISAQLDEILNTFERNVPHVQAMSRQPLLSSLMG